MLQYCKYAKERIYARDTTGKRDGRKETLHEENAAGGRQGIETLKKEAMLGNQ